MNWVDFSYWGNPPAEKSYYLFFVGLAIFFLLFAAFSFAVGGLGTKTGRYRLRPGLFRCLRIAGFIVAITAIHQATDNSRPRFWTLLAVTSAAACLVGTARRWHPAHPHTTPESVKSLFDE